MKFKLLIFFIIINVNVWGQKIKIYGTISTPDKNNIPGVTIRAANTNYITTSDPQGYYELKVYANRKYKIIYSNIGYKTDTLIIKVGTKNFAKNIELISTDYGLNPIYTIANSIDEGGMQRISSRNLSVLPDVSGNAVETLIKTSMGVSSNNELSSQYNVRGGNFDENLIYVNGIEIYRPFLVRSGQQEGMSFINSDLVGSIKFSAGGYGVQYDDKISSVLDITYKTPEKFFANATINLLGGKAHIENVSKNKKLYFIAGIRYKRSRYLFNTFDVKGDYKPVFSDFQTFSTYKINQKLSVSFLGNITSNIYSFIPTFSESEFGTFNQRMKISVYYDGKERDTYQTLFGALTLNYKAKDNLRFRLNSSSYYTNEAEKYDISAYYWLNEAATQSDSTHAVGDSVLNLGYGGYISHARNYLNALINDIELKSYLSTNNHFLQFGIKYKREQINDQMNEWKYIDSAGYSINSQRQYSINQVNIYKSVKAKNFLTINRLNAYIQDNFTFNAATTKIKLRYGLRASINDYNKQLLISPRLSMLISPSWDKNWFFRISTGIYYQPPFYRELRRFDGTLVKNQTAERAIHFVAGAYHTLKIWNRPFKLSSEIYYKKLDNLIPYELDNLSIRYYADEKSHGYATGIDFKLYGEFVPGTDSWVSLSFLKTMEDIYNDSYNIYLDKNGNRTFNKYEIADTTTIYPGYLPRPSDQRINLSIFFQDYVPGHKNFKVNLAYFFGTSVPFGPPEKGRYLAVLRSAAPYLRGDIGFSFLLKNPKKKYPNKKFLKPFYSIWGQLEIFNFMGIRNIASYNWVELVPNTSNPYPISYQTIAVPNRLTGRLLNLKITFNFK